MKNEVAIKQVGNPNVLTFDFSNFEENINEGNSLVLENEDDVECEEFNLPKTTKDLCHELFSIDGIFEINLFTKRIFITKLSSFEWKDLLPKIIKALKKIFGGDLETTN
ncbi:MAG: hypothetical protein RI945_94 [Candidatus Parcubacteria bacterium]|jgi:hypothetical protein